MRTQNVKGYVLSFTFSENIFSTIFQTKTKILSLRKKIFLKKKICEKKRRFFEKSFEKHKCLIMSESNFLSKNIFQQIIF